MSGFAARGGFGAVQPWPATAKNRSPKGGRPSALPYPGRQPPDPCNNVAMRFNPPVAALVARLKSAGRLKPKQIVVAAMRKLLVLCFGVLKTGKRFDPAIAMQA